MVAEAKGLNLKATPALKQLLTRAAENPTINSVGHAHCSSEAHLWLQMLFPREEIRAQPKLPEIFCERRSASLAGTQEPGCCFGSRRERFMEEAPSHLHGSAVRALNLLTSTRTAASQKPRLGCGVSSASLLEALGLCRDLSLL